ncbi:SlyX family protein [Planctomyces sp. SH-PL14]|uniref:SlyX family protein n=1 Tax=Planctomyces sp. SH-PL14 TaxID=1632864 RepID=UPI00078B8F96|nr:SlyX family protein [Planctomyces sp. SH-PL14]AMV19115.1 Protein SlyX [Planctomyces sp. SH-PL14]
MAQESERLAAVESLLMHVQYDVEQLNKAVLGQQAEIARLRTELMRFRSEFEDHAVAPRDPAAEKPPHYGGR